MFDESIFDNICLHEDYSEKELQSALSDSGLSSFIKQVPNGLEYHVGENGANLSGGQKQRIAVARALIDVYKRQDLNYSLKTFIAG